MSTPAFDTEIDLRNATPADAEDVAGLLTSLGYPCESADAGERIAMVLHNDRQALILARHRGIACGLLSLDFMYYLPLGTTTCRVTALVVNEDARGQGLGRLLLRDAERRARLAQRDWKSPAPVTAPKPMPFTAPAALARARCGS
jgi:GNAT superfamily N-acetyltransferase